MGRKGAGMWIIAWWSIEPEFVADVESNELRGLRFVFWSGMEGKRHHAGIPSVCLIDPAWKEGLFAARSGEGEELSGSCQAGIAAPGRDVRLSGSHQQKVGKADRRITTDRTSSRRGAVSADIRRGGWSGAR